MHPVFQLLAGLFEDNWRIGWYLGLVVYWLVWGGIFPRLMIGSGLMGFYLSLPAKRTGTIWWTILARALGGFVMMYSAHMLHGDPI